MQTAQVDFPSRLRTLIKDAGVDQTTLAAETGIDRSAINKLANGHRSPTMKELVALANYFELTPAGVVLTEEMLQPVVDAVAAFVDSEDRCLSLDLRASLAEARLTAAQTSIEGMITQHHEEMMRMRTAKPAAQDEHELSMKLIRAECELSKRDTELSVAKAVIEVLERQNAEMRRQVVERHHYHLQSAGTQAVFGVARSVWRC